MLVCIPNVLDAAQLVSLRERLDRANDAWVDGRVTAGHQGAPVKFNQQIDERSDVALACQRIVGAALERNPLFISAALPNIALSADVQPLQRRHEVRRPCRRQRAHPSARRAQAAHRRVGDAVPHQPRRLRRRRAADRGHLRPPQHQAGGRRHGGLSGDQPAPGDADHARRAHSRASSGCRAWSATTRSARCSTRWTTPSSASTRPMPTRSRGASLIGCYHNLVREWSET